NGSSISTRTCIRNRSYVQKWCPSFPARKSFWDYDVRARVIFTEKYSQVPHFICRILTGFPEDLNPIGRKKNTSYILYCCKRLHAAKCEIFPLIFVRI